MKNVIMLMLILVMYTALTPLCVAREQLTVYVDNTSNLDKAINKIVNKEHVAIIRAMVWVESRDDSTAISATGDYGIMQVNKKTWYKKYDFRRMTELEYGLQAGYDIFKYCLEVSCGDIRYALKLYNGSWSYPDRIYMAMEKKEYES